jgi:DNA polymerase III subunit delta'
MIADQPVGAVVTGRFRTRGHDAAVAAVRAMVAGRSPHALLIGGPPGIGKTTLALDLAAGLLCDDPDPAARPCRACRACRLVDRGIHPDAHRLAPAGPGDQIRIGSRENPEDGTIRRLSLDLALLPVEGGARLAILERADRMGDDAQTALLKTLEEPPAGVTIVLCADDEDRLMPTVRSRCARIRLGPVGVREIESILEDADLADAPLAARLARLAGGRPGLARSLALAPDAIAARDELARTLLHLLDAAPSLRLAASRELLDLATTMDRALERVAREAAGATADSVTETGRTARSGRGGSRRTTRAGAARSAGPDPAEPAADEATDGSEPEGVAPAMSASAAQRRHAAATIVSLWRDLARDLVVAALGIEREVRDPGLLDDLRAAATALGAGQPGDRRAVGATPDPVAAALTGFLARLDGAGELLEANVRPELVLDTLLLAWPVPSASPAAPAAGSGGRSA